MLSWRFFAPLAALAVVAAAVHYLTGDPFLYLPAAGGAVAAVALDAGLRVYRRAPAGRRHALVWTAAAAVAGLTALLAWAVAASPPRGAEWVAAAALFLLPLTLAALLARRNGARPGA